MESLSFIKGYQFLFVSRTMNQYPWNFCCCKSTIKTFFFLNEGHMKNLYHATELRNAASLHLSKNINMLSSVDCVVALRDTQ